MNEPRKAGILLHPTSLPGSPGIGDLGDGAFRFLEELSAAGQRIWQVLPLGPTGYGDSPYQCLSAFAGNPLLLSPTMLVADGLIPGDAAGRVPAGAPDRVDFGAVIPAKTELLRVAWEAFEGGAAPHLREDWEAFRKEEEWLKDYALFGALHEKHAAGWTEWPEPVVRRDPEALADAEQELAGPIGRISFAQFLFFRQWEALRRHASEHDIEIVGDLPIFVAHDCADVWAHRELFDLDESGRPIRVAGAPPDDFTEDGQLWGNPIYRWSLLEERGFDWWIDRVRHSLRLFDRIRIDHFRGFAAGWTVDAAATTARDGRWDPGPGAKLFDALRDALGDLPLIAEDLGDITEDVRELRVQLGLPGMKVLLFGFNEDPGPNEFAPHRHRPDFVVYTGTHDNETVRGWWTEGLDATRGDAAEEQRQVVRKYLGNDASEVHWDFIRMAYTSVADVAIVPMQDVLGLGNEARMNVPGRPDGNWSWRMEGGWTDEVRSRLRDLVGLAGR